MEVTSKCKHFLSVISAFVLRPKYQESVAWRPRAQVPDSSPTLRPAPSPVAAGLQPLRVRSGIETRPDRAAEPTLHARCWLPLPDDPGRRGWSWHGHCVSTPTSSRGLSLAPGSRFCPSECDHRQRLTPSLPACSPWVRGGSKAGRGLYREPRSLQSHAAGLVPCALER